MSFCQLFARKADDENAVGRRDAHAHDGAGKGRNGQGRMREEKHPDDPGQRCRKRHDDDEGIEPGLEIDDDDEKNQDDRESEAEESCW